MTLEIHGFSPRCLYTQPLKTTPKLHALMQRLYVVRKSGIHHKGVFASTDIPEGTRIIEYTGDKITKAESDRRADAAIEAHKKKDFSAKTLSGYQKRLNETFILKDLKQYRKMSAFLKNHPEFMDIYPAFMNDALGMFFTGFGKPKGKLYKDIFRSLTKRRPLFKAVGDLVAFGRAVTGI